MPSARSAESDFVTGSNPSTLNWKVCSWNVRVPVPTQNPMRLCRLQRRQKSGRLAERTGGSDALSASDVRNHQREKKGAARPQAGAETHNGTMPGDCRTTLAGLARPALSHGGNESYEQVFCSGQNCHPSCGRDRHAVGLAVVGTDRPAHSPHGDAWKARAAAARSVARSSPRPQPADRRALGSDGQAVLCCGRVTPAIGASMQNITATETCERRR